MERGETLSVGRVRKVAFRERGGGTGNQTCRGREGKMGTAAWHRRTFPVENMKTDGRAMGGGGLQLANRQVDVYEGKSILEPIFCC